MGGRVSGRRGRRAIRRRPVVHRGVSRRGRGGGGIHRCGSLRADDCGLIDRGGRISAGTSTVSALVVPVCCERGLYLKNSTVKPRASARTRETYKGRSNPFPGSQAKDVHCPPHGGAPGSPHGEPRVLFSCTRLGRGCEILQKPGRPLPCPYLPTYLPTLLMGN